MKKKQGATFADERIIIDADTWLLPCIKKGQKGGFLRWISALALAICKQSVVVTRNKRSQASLFYS